MNISDILARLCGASGVSGDEAEACAVAEELLRQYTSDVRTDAFGCVYGVVGSPGNGKPSVLLEAHIDEIGFIVTYIDDNGFLKVGNCGGTDRRLYAAQSVTVHGEHGCARGVICTLPPHVRKEDGGAMKTEDICIDIGCTSRESAEKLVSPGDRVTIDEPLAVLNGTRVTAKAIDDRGGVASVLYALELLKGRELPVNIEVLFSSQEEVGERGAAIGAYNVTAQTALSVDTSFAYTSDDKREDCGEMGKGVMIGVSPVLDRAVTDELKKLAADGKIPFQLEIMDCRTGTDADEISLTKGGIRTGLLSIPIKYMHTPVEVADTEDIISVSRLMAAFVTGGAANV